MTVDEWLATLPAKARADINVLCSACGVFSPGFHWEGFAPLNVDGEKPWVDYIPPVIALVCNECNSALEELRERGELLHAAQLFEFSRRTHPTATDEWIHRRAELLAERSKRQHLTSV